jgi:transposase, IS5 family
LYKKPNDQLSIDDFMLPFEGKLKADNRWVQMAKIIPWNRIENDYAKLFPNNIGQVAKPARMAIGALIIKEKLNLSDEETVQQITENPYLQYFIGFKEYRQEQPFDPSLMVHFRKRFGLDGISAINELIMNIEKEDHNDDDEPKNKGTLLIDATCAPADIRYPTDLSLLNEAREKTEKIIDTLYSPLKGTIKKPRTYRQKARKRYLAISKKRKVKKTDMRKAIGQQLRYLTRNLNHIEKLQEISTDEGLSNRQLREFKVIKTLYAQQSKMHKEKSHSVEERIVSISQSHVRPIVRGKVKTPTEFGAKVSISLVDGYASIEKLSWNNYHEGDTLIPAIERYYEQRGYYPLVVGADAIYRNRKNLQYCKEKGIRLSGPRLGRPPKVVTAAEKRQARLDSRKRNEVEGAFGVTKRRYGLSLIMAKLQETSETVIALQFLVMNLEHRLKLLFVLLSKSVLSRFRALFSKVTGCLTPVIA